MRISAVASRVALSIGLLLPIASSVIAQKPDPIWLDRPLTGWNKAGDPLPKPPSSKNQGQRSSAVAISHHLYQPRPSALLTRQVGFHS